MNPNHCLESSQQQVTCYQESSRQQNFMSKHFLGNKILWPATSQDFQKEADCHVRFSVSVCLILLPRKCSDVKFCSLELSWQQATCCRELSRQQFEVISCLESSRQQVACCPESSQQQVAFCREITTKSFLRVKIWSLWACSWHFGRTKYCCVVDILEFQKRFEMFFNHFTTEFNNTASH